MDGGALAEDRLEIRRGKRAGVERPEPLLDRQRPGERLLDADLLVGNDRQTMGKYVNGRIARTLGWLYFGILCVLAVAAPVLFMATNGGG